MRIISVLPAAVVGAAVLAPVTAAYAAPVSQNLNYTCHYPLIGDLPLVVGVRIDDVPDLVPHGTKMPALSFHNKLLFNADTDEAFNFLGARSLDGVAKLEIKLDSQDYNLLTLTTNHAVTPKTFPGPFPPFGSFIADTNGSLIPIIYNTPGSGYLHAGAVKLHLSLKDGSGNPVATSVVSPTNPVTCTLNGGDAILASFLVT